MKRNGITILSRAKRQTLPLWVAFALILSALSVRAETLCIAPLSSSVSGWHSCRRTRRCSFLFAYVIPAYFFNAREEEEMMIGKFGESYPEYRDRVQLLFQGPLAVWR